MVYQVYGVGDYQNLLIQDSFVNFRQLLYDVSLRSAMGAYLNMVNNDKPVLTVRLHWCH